MLEYFETLIAFSDMKTMERAALHLRVTQPTISKRLAALETLLGKQILQPNGRRVELTIYGKEVAKQARKSLSELKEIIERHGGDPSEPCHLGVCDSILLGQYQRVFKGIRSNKIMRQSLDVHSHRSPLVHLHVCSGKYHLGIIAGEMGRSTKKLKSLLLNQEPFWLLCRQQRLPDNWSAKLISIEPTSSTWQQIEKVVDRRFRSWQLPLRIKYQCESFDTAAILASQGFGVAMVPQSVAFRYKERGVFIHALPSPGIQRHIYLIARKSILKRPSVRRIYQQIAGNFSDI